jgi:hypothetical protein
MSRYRVLPADPRRHQADVLAVLARNLPELAPERFLWNLDPAHQAGARWWLAQEVESGAFVGVAGLFPRRFRVAGRACLAAVAGDFAVDQAHRAFGPALLLQKTLLAAMPELGLDFIYSIPNRMSEALILKLGYHPIGAVEKYTKVLRTEYRQGAWLPPEPLSRAAAGPLNAAFAFFSREHRWRRPPRFSVETPERFDERFDRFWMRTADQWPIMGVRTAEHLTWRFTRSPHQAYRCFALVGPEREVLGYIVYFLKDNICRIADLSELNEPGIGDALLAEFLLHLRRLQAGSVVVRHIGRKDLIRRLSAFGFLRQSKPQAKLMVYSYPLPWPGIRDPGAWMYFEGDNDI